MTWGKAEAAPIHVWSRHGLMDLHVCVACGKKISEQERIEKYNGVLPLLECEARK